MQGLRAAFAALLLALPASAAPAPPQMAAVGLLKLGRHGACSGTLIAPDLVLTAAHCLTRDRREIYPPRDVAFETGRYPGFERHQFPAQDVVVHPLYLGSDGSGPEALPRDAGLVRLARPVPPDVARPIPVVEARAGSPTFLASYRAGHGARARERRCPILHESDEVVSLSCDVRPGESGSPILISENGRLGLVAIVSASSKVKRTEVALAARASRLLLGLRAMMGDI